MIYPTKFVDWAEVHDWSWRLARKVRGSAWRPDVIVAVGRGGLVVSRMLCDLLEVEELLALPVRWHERERRNGETYLADLVRAYARAHADGSPPDGGIAEVVSSLEVKVDFEPEADLRGRRALLVEEIVATGMHFKVAKEIIGGKYGSSETRTATLVWKGPEISLPDYYVIRPGKFVWFQFPWSRLSDYVQFLRAMLAWESKDGGRHIWSEDEVKEKFMAWYGGAPDEKYLREALSALERDGTIELLDGRRISARI
ncbi:MAG: phosphoribosyltransferase [Conexivisphaera sp.]|nr:phosphoribosyltransferase family protein [Conexivisphaerales archaeon]